VKVKLEPLSDIDDDDLFLPSEYNQPIVTLEAMLDATMQSRDLKQQCHKLENPPKEEEEEEDNRQVLRRSSREVVRKNLAEQDDSSDLE
jgi:hypothetical protein